MSNTPETEKVKAALHTNWHDLLNHARKLERERDEAREKYATEATEHMLAVNKICNERDEAVEEIIEWKTLCLWWGTPEHIHGFIRGQQTRIWHLEQERDEAREAILGWENKWRCAVDMAARAELERDDALDDAKEYHIKMVGLINERNDAREDARILSERLTALELQSTAELARLEQELINMKELHESNN